MSTRKGIAVGGLVLLCILCCVSFHGGGFSIHGRDSSSLGPESPIRRGAKIGSVIYRSDLPEAAPDRLPHSRRLLVEGSDAHLSGSSKPPAISGDQAQLLTDRRRRMGEDSSCSCTMKDIIISQGRVSSASGIPQYVVQIVNTCMSHDCAPSDIHVYCGWFASPPLVNPNVFRRTEFNDCLINNGKPLRYGEIIRFQYANSFMYPLKLRSAKFC